MSATATYPVTSPVTGFYVSGGTMQPDAPSYVERQADRDLLTALRAGDYCYVLNSRQMGKSSLCVRTMARLREEGIHTVFLDLTKFGGRNLTAEQWYAALLAELGRELGLRAECLAYWKEHPELPPVQRLFGAITEVALEGQRVQGAGYGVQGTAPAEDRSDRSDRSDRTDTLNPEPLTLNPRLVIFVDEIDVTRSLPFNTDEFFAAIRQCYVGRATEPALSRVTFCLLGTATPAELIEDTRISPFNIGRRIEVRDFTAEEAAPLAEGLAAGSAGVPPACPTTDHVAKGHAGGTPALPGADAERLLRRILYWTGGHPYLTQRLCLAVADVGQSASLPVGNSRQAGSLPHLVDRVCEALFLTHTAKEGDDNLALVRNRLLKSEVDLASLLELYGKLRAGQGVADDETNALCGVVKLSGVAKVEGGRLAVRNRIYERVFDREWVRQHMPDAEVRRQREAYRRGLARAAGLASAVVAVMAGLALAAVNQSHRADRNLRRADMQRRLAEEQKVTLRRNLYAADVNLAQQVWETENMGRARELLDAHRPEPGQEELRGFEWRYLWRLCQGDALFTFSRRQGWVNSVAFSPDGKTLASDGGNGEVTLWDIATRQELSKLPEAGGGPAFSPDGKTLATGSADRTVKLWDIATRQERSRLPGAGGGPAFSPDGKTLATRSRRTLKLWDVATRRELAILKGHQANVRSVAFSPDGKTLATGSFDRTARLWDLTTRKEVATLRGHKERVVSVAFSRDGRTLATGSVDKTIKLWDVPTRRELATLRGHDSATVSVAFSPDGKRLATGSADHTLKLWDVATRREVATLKGHLDGIWSLAFSPDGQMLATGSHDHTVKLWSATPKREITTLRGYKAAVSSVAFLPDGKTLATVSRLPFQRAMRTGGVKLWDVVANRETATLEVHPGGLLTFSPDGKTLAASHGWSDAAGLPSSEDGRRSSVRLWNVTTRREAGALRGHPNGVKAMAFSPDGKTLATGGADNSVKLWDVAARRELVTLQGHTDLPTTVAFSLDGQTLATGSEDKTVKLWDVATSRELATLKGHQAKVCSVAFSPDGKTLATGGADNSIRLWDVTRQEPVAILKGHKFWVASVTFSPDGKTLASGSDNTIKLWNVLTGREVLNLKGHQGGVYSVAFSPDGNTLASGSGDQTVRLWHAASFAETDARNGEPPRGQDTPNPDKR